MRNSNNQPLVFEVSTVLLLRFKGCKDSLHIETDFRHFKINVYDRSYIVLYLTLTEYDNLQAYF